MAQYPKLRYIITLIKLLQASPVNQFYMITHTIYNPLSTFDTVFTYHSDHFYSPRNKRSSSQTSAAELRKGSRLLRFISSLHFEYIPALLLTHFHRAIMQPPFFQYFLKNCLRLIPNNPVLTLCIISILKQSIVLLLFIMDIHVYNWRRKIW